MRKFSKAFNESKQQFEVQDEALNYISSNELQKYLEVCDKFLTQPAKYVINWLIDNNSNYIHDLGQNEKNALIAFYNKGVPTEEKYKELYKNIGLLIKDGLYMQIPVFQTREQFDDILNKKVSLDEIAIDLTTERGRNAIVRKYEALYHKIIKTFVGKSSLPYDELYSVALEGVANAINDYGKKSKTQQEAEENNDVIANDEELSKRKTQTFQQFLAWRVRYAILTAIEQESHLVRIPKSQQREMKQRDGYIARSNSVSGDTKIGGSDEEGGKTLFDIIGGVERPGRSIDMEEADKLRDKIIQAVKNNFKEKEFEVFMNQLKDNDDPTKLSGKAEAEKFGYNSPASITAIKTKIKQWLRTNPKVKDLVWDYYELFHENKHEDEYYERDISEPVHLGVALMSERNSGVNNVDGK
jgi:hypothetical protein